MKRIISFWGIIILIIHSSLLSAQTTCDQNFTVTPIVTPSTCQANGSITVTLGGNTANLFNIEYGLTDGNFTIPAQPSNVLQNVPSGTYSLTVRAFCSVDANFDVVKTVSNVIVGGTYQVPIAEFNAGSSRKPYAGCNTGIIALNVTRGSGTFTFTITSAPSGVTVPQIVSATKNGNVYTLAGSTYPAGAYTIEVSDGCVQRNVQFNLESVTGFPTFYTTAAYFNGVSPYNTCNTVRWTLINSSNSSNLSGDYLRYYNDGMYEISMSTGTNTADTWVTWSSWAQTLTLSNGSKYSDGYASNSLKLNIRIKNCPSVKNSISSYLNRGNISASKTKDCNGYTVSFSPSSISYYLICYPVSIELKDGSTVIWSATGLNYSDLPVQANPILQYNHNYTYTVKDANGVILNDNVSIKEDLYTNSSSITNRCDGYYWSTQPADGCWPQYITITRKSDGYVMHQGTASSYILFPTTNVLFDYGETYTFTSRSGSHTGTTLYAQDFSVSAPWPYSAIVYKGTSCAEGSGYFYINNSSSYSLSGVSSWGYTFNSFPQGTKVRVVSPSPVSGYTGNEYAANYSFDLPTVQLPAGTYTIEVDDGCGAPKTVQVTYAGGYDGSALSYISVLDQCVGLKVTPTGLLKLGGTNIATTYYRVTAGPAGGYDPNKVISSATTDYFTFTLSGTYKIGIMSQNSASGCVYREIDVVYTAPPPLQLNTAITSSYVCVGGGDGHITIAAQNGMPPYKYELWNDAKTIKLAPDIVKNDATPAYFNYGLPNTTYKIVVSDACGNNFEQNVMMYDLATATIVYAPNSGQVCEGDAIQLNCLTLGITTYSWTGPNGWTSTQQNPVRTGAQTSWSGTYTVTVQPEHCGTPIIQDVTVTVNPLPAAPAVPNATLNYCQNVTAPSLLSATGATATANNTLRWYSSDGTTVITPPSSINTSTTGSTTYYVSQVNSTTGCESAKVTVTVTINARPAVPASASTSPASMCPNTAFSITVSPTPTSGTYYKVYSASTNGTLLGQSPSGSGIVSNLTAPAISTTYYVATVNSSSCESTTRKSVSITINNAATKNNIDISGTTQICYGVNTTLTASLSGITVTSPVYRWYSSQTETTPFHTGSSYTTSNLTKDSTFYVSVSGNNYCENAHNSRKEVTVTVYDKLVAGFISHTTTNYCYRVSTLEIKLENVPLSGGSGRYSYQWQSSTDGIQWSDIVGIYTLDYSISGLDQTTYYRRAVVDTVCGTVYSDIDTVYRIRSIQPFQTDICTGLTVHISPSTNGLWKSSDPSIVEVVNNNSIVGINPGEAELSFYDSLAGNCDTTIDIKVYAYPNPDEITGAKVVCIGETIELTNTTPGGDWTKNNDNVSFDNPQANPVKVTGKTEGNSFVTYTVTNGICKTKRTFRVQVIPNSPPPKIIIGVER